MYRSRVLVCRRLSLPAYTRVTIFFCYIFGGVNGIGLYAGRLTPEYTVYGYNFQTKFVPVIDH